MTPLSSTRVTEGMRASAFTWPAVTEPENAWMIENVWSTSIEEADFFARPGLTP